MLTDDLTPLSAVAPSGASGEALCAAWWVPADGAVRLRRRREGPAELMLHVSTLESVVAVAGCAEAGAAGGSWGAVGALGLSSGRVLALRPAPRAHRALHAHSAPIADLALCPRVSLLVTASVDGVVVLWDLNECVPLLTFYVSNVCLIYNGSTASLLPD